MTSSPSTDAPLSEEQVPETTTAAEEQPPQSGVDPLKLAGVAALAGVGVFGLASRTSLLQPRPEFRPSRENVDAALKANPLSANRPIRNASFNRSRALPGAATAPVFSQSWESDDLPTTEQEETSPVTWPNLQRLPGEGTGIARGEVQAAMTPLPIARSTARKKKLASASQSSSSSASNSTTSTASTSVPSTSTTQSLIEPTISSSSRLPETKASSPSVDSNRSNSQPDRVAVAPFPNPTIAFPNSANETPNQSVFFAPPPSSSPTILPETATPADPASVPPSYSRNQGRLKFIVGAKPSPRFTIPALRRGSGCPSSVGITPVVPAIAAQSQQADVESTMSDQLTVFLHVSQAKADQGNHKLQLTLQQDSQDQDLYNKVIDLDEVRGLAGGSGIIGIQLPKHNASLEVGETYLWQAAVLCDAEDPSKNPIANGWVQRLAPKAAPVALADQAGFYAEQGVWLDALNAVMQNEQQNPQQARQDWSDLIESADLKKDWVNEPLILIDPVSLNGG